MLNGGSLPTRTIPSSSTQIQPRSTSKSSMKPSIGPRKSSLSQRPTSRKPKKFVPKMPKKNIPIRPKKEEPSKKKKRKKGSDDDEEGEGSKTGTGENRKIVPRKKMGWKKPKIVNQAKFEKNIAKINKVAAAYNEVFACLGVKRERTKRPKHDPEEAGALVIWDPNELDSSEDEEEDDSENDSPLASKKTTKRKSASKSKPKANAKI